MANVDHSGVVMQPDSTRTLRRFGPMRTYSTDRVVDAIVVGTGAGGSPLLSRLAAAGLSVVAIEAGAAWNPAEDFATDEREQSKLFWRHERLTGGSNPVAFGGNNSGKGVGGGTLHYTAYTPRPQPDDLRLHTDFGVGVDWPIEFEEIEPYLEEAEKFMGVSGPTPYPWGPPRRRGYPLAPLPLNGAAQLMAKGCAELGIKTSPAANAALSGSYYQPGVGYRPACTNRGYCQAGCSTGAKASMDVTYLPLAVKHGAEIRAECLVTTVERDANGRISGVVYRDKGGREVRQRCRNLFLCAGAVETPRLLLLNDLCTKSGHVGRHFTAHVGRQVWATFDADVRPYKGIPGGLISEDTHRPKDADFAGGYLLQSIGVMPVTYAAQFARGTLTFGRELVDHLADYNHVAGINVLGECLPREENFLELSDELDDLGLPKPRVHFSPGENELALDRHGQKNMLAIFDAVGAKNVWEFDRYAHAMGTCRMAADGDDGVIDAQGKSFEVDNLFVCDISTFPTALSVNPVLTQVALALRTADRFLAAG